MAYEIVKCEVRWIASYGISGDELPPARWETLGEFETEGDACRALAEAGLTRKDWGWCAMYSHGNIQRVLRELNNVAIRSDYHIYSE